MTTTQRIGASSIQACALVVLLGSCGYTQNVFQISMNYQFRFTGKLRFLETPPIFDEIAEGCGKSSSLIGFPWKLRIIDSSKV